MWIYVTTIKYNNLTFKVSSGYQYVSNIKSVIPLRNVNTTRFEVFKSACVHFGPRKQITSVTYPRFEKESVNLS